MKAEWYLGVMVLAIVALGLIPVANSIKAHAPDQAQVSLLESAQALVDKGGCYECHTIPGIPKAVGKVGPSWCEPAGEFREGKVDLEFIRESILNPNAEVGAGFPRDKMPQNFGQVFNDKEIETLVTFISTLECKE